jgi:hypothetical protein
MSPTSGNRTALNWWRRTFNPGATASTIYSNPTDTLTQVLVTGEYFYNRRYGGLVSFTRTTGTYDPLANGGNGSPANQYETFELDYVPWLNFRLILQYDVYQVVANNQSPFNLSNATFPNSPGFPNIRAGEQQHLGIRTMDGLLMKKPTIQSLIAAALALGLLLARPASAAEHIHLRAARRRRS